MNAADVIGYAYEADVHCIECAQQAFAHGKLHRDPQHPHAQPGFDWEGLPLDACDREGNRIHAVFADDEGAESEHCGDCNVALIDIDID